LKAIKGFEAQGKAAEKKMEEARVKGTNASLALEKYAGAYKDDMYGDAKVTQENGKLVLRTPSFVGDLEHWHYDTFRVTWRDRTLGKALVNFTLNEEGKVDSMGVKELQLSFKRAPEETPAAAAVSLSEADLKKLTGKYEMKTPPIEVSIEMIGGRLKAVVPGQPVYSLVAVSPTRFQIEGAPAGYFVQFELSEGRVKSLTLIQGAQPNITLLPKQ
jgi:hypothetical protein